MRHTGDYDDCFDFTRDGVEEFLPRTISLVEKLIAKSQDYYSRRIYQRDEWRLKYLKREQIGANAGTPPPPPLGSVLKGLENRK